MSGRAARALLAAALGLAGCGDPAGAPTGAPVGAPVGAPAESRPDVLLVVVDTLRADRAGILPGGPPTAPQLRAWSRTGTRFSQAIAPSSWTLPSIASLFAGQDARAHALPGAAGLTTRHGADPGRATLAERFAAAGYRTIGLVANPLLTPQAGFARGFDEYLLAPAGATADLSASVHELRAWDAEALVARTLAALASAPAEQPLFLYLHLMDTHVPYDPANEALARPWPRWTDDAGGQGPLVDWAGTLSPEQRELLVGWRTGYDGQVAFVDRALGRLFERLGELRARAPLVAVTADHGEGLFTHLRNSDSPPESGPLGAAYGDHGEQLFEEALRVPLWLAGPGVPARDEPRPVALRDLGATLLALCGLPSDGPRLPLDPAAEGPASIVGAGTRGWFVRTATHKLIVPFPERVDAAGLAPQLFAVTAERYEPELDDLALTDVATRQALSELWGAWRAAAVEESLQPLDPSTEQALKALGYVR